MRIIVNNIFYSTDTDHAQLMCGHIRHHGELEQLELLYMGKTGHRMFILQIVPISSDGILWCNIPINTFLRDRNQHYIPPLNRHLDYVCVPHINITSIMPEEEIQRITEDVDEFAGFSKFNSFLILPSEDLIYEYLSLINRWDLLGNMLGMSDITEGKHPKISMC